MTCGIYYYWDNKENIIVYIGQSVNIEKRHIGHLSPSECNKQPFNKILQNNKDRYELYIMLECTKNELNEQEILAIKMYNPKFNFTKGGQCFSTQIPWNKGKKHPKASEYMKKNNPVYKDEVVEKIISTNIKNGFYKRRSECMKKNNHMIGRFGKKHHNYGKISPNNITGVLHLSIILNKKLKNGYAFAYIITDKGKVIYRKTSVDLCKIRDKIIQDGYKWDIQDKNKYEIMVQKIREGGFLEWYQTHL